MNSLLRTFAFATLAAVLCSTPARAEEVKAGDLVITQAWSRATPNGAKIGGGYLTIENKGSAPDRLIGGSGDIAGKVEVHEMAMDNGVMTMRPLDKGLDHRAWQDGEARAGRLSFDDVRSEGPAEAGREGAGHARIREGRQGGDIAGCAGRRGAGAWRRGDPAIT